MERFFKYIPYILMLFFVVGIFTAGYIYLVPKDTSEYNANNKVYFNCENMSINVGESTVIDADFVSEDDNGIIEWTSSNTDVVVVNNGNIQALKSGEAIITAKFKDYNISKECKITVFDNSSTTNLVLNTNQLLLKIGEKYLLSANVGNDNLRWISSDESVVQVNNGEVVATGVGSAVITVSYDQHNVVVEVVVSDNTTNNTNVNEGNDKTNSGDISVNEGNSNIGNTNVNGGNDKTNSGDISVNEGNNNTNSGDTNVNEGNNNANSGDTNVDKVVNVSSVTLDKSSVTMFLKESVTLTAIISPSTATNQNVTWSSSNKDVVTVKNGVVSAVGIGTSTVTVVTKDGKKKASAEITVKENIVNVTELVLNADSLTMSKGDKKTLKATISPSNATNKNVVWSSSNESVATVVDGVVTAKGNGTALIIAKSNNGKSASCTVIVGKPTLKISKSTMSIIDEDTRKLTASLSYDLIDQSVTWSSSNTKIVTVDSNGNVKGKSVGTAVITAKSNYDPSITVECEVTVGAAKFLFIGNSKTYYPGAVNEDNGIPKRFKAIAENAGYTIEYTQAVISGVALNKILADEDCINKIKKKYDYVIVNQGTDRAYNSRDGYYSDINTIKTWTEAKNSNVKIYVRKFWLRIRKDSNGLPDGGSTEAQIQKSYDNAEYVANKLGVNTINDGPLFYDMMDNKSSIHIMRYQDGVTTDLTHQNSNGAYLAALCFYAEVYDRDPTKITYNAGIKESTANTLKTYAKKHCYNN